MKFVRTIVLFSALSACGAAADSPSAGEESVDPRDDGLERSVAGKADSVHQTCTPTVGFGAFTYGGVWQGMEPVERLETRLGRRLDVVHWFMNFEHEWPAHGIQSVRHAGRAPMISWQPHRQSLRDIAAGVYDDYLRTWARHAAALDDVVYLRPFPEMNGSWVGWWEGDPDALVAAWRHVVDIFAEEGAEQVRWVWSPNVTDEPRTPENRMELYYPGDAYVDVLAVDGYNRGDAPWVSFDEKFQTAYARLIALGPQPVWIAEVGSTESGGDKAKWVRDMLTTTRFPRLEMIVWFDEDKEWDWRISSSEETCVAFCQCLSGQSRVECLAGDGRDGCSTILYR